MVEQDRVEFVKSKLLSTKSIKLKNLWAFECVHFYIQQCPTIDNETLIAQTLEQFLLADLVDAANPVFPATIEQRRESFELNGTFVAQLIYLIDISESPYDQWRKLHNKTLDEADDGREPKAFQTKKRRVFKLQLTDGFKTVTAMEYTTIPVLNTKLSPGLKLQIVGPVQVVNHIILLEPKNLKILGGDVDKLLVVNAYENVLLRALNRPTTDTPITDYNEAQLVADNNAPRRQIEAKPMLSSKRVEPEPKLPSLEKQDEEFLASIDFDNLDDDIDMAAIEQLEEEGRRQIMNREQARSQNQQAINAIEPMDEDEEFLADIDFEALENQIQVKPRCLSRPQNQKPPVRNISCNSVSSSSSGVVAARETFRPPTLDVSTIQPDKVYSVSDDLYKFKTTDDDNIATIDQFLALKASDKMKRNFVIKAELHVVVPKSLKVKSNQWTVRVELTDAYSHKLLPVRIHNDVLEKLSGHSGEKVSLMFIESKTRVQVKEDIFDIIESLQKRIEKLSCFMKIEMEFNPQSQSSCQVIELLQPSAENSATFRRKLEEEKLLEVT